ncbi:MAG: PspA/IM30 family protein, partial [Cyanobacteria bacterium J06642_11]
MNKILYWLMGDYGANAIIALWNWVCDVSEEDASGSDADAIASAEVSLKIMQTSVKKLYEAHQKQFNTYQTAKAT